MENKEVEKLENQILKLSDFYEKEEGIKKYQYEAVKKLFEKFVSNGIYFVPRLKTTKWRENTFFPWDESYFITTFWTFSNIFPKINRHKCPLVNISFDEKWFFTIAIYAQFKWDLERVNNFNNFVIKKLKEILPDFVERNKIEKKDDINSFYYWTEKTNDYNLLFENIKKINKEFEKIEWIDLVWKDYFIKKFWTRLNVIEKNILKEENIDMDELIKKVEDWHEKNKILKFEEKYKKKLEHQYNSFKKILPLAKEKYFFSTTNRIGIQKEEDKNYYLFNWWWSEWNYVTEIRTTFWFFEKNDLISFYVKDNEKFDITFEKNEIKEIFLKEIEEKLVFEKNRGKWIRWIKYTPDILKECIDIISKIIDKKRIDEETFFKNFNKRLNDIEKYRKILNQKIMTNNFQTETELLSNKKQIILYWPPWTGKTYNIKNIIKEHSWWENYEDLQKSWRVEFITFHQSFSYEEFIEGIKPDLDWTEINYEIKSWIFKEICDRAKTKNSANINEKIEWLKEKLSENDIEIKENTDFILKYRWWKTFKFSPKSSKYPDVDYPVNIENIIKLYKWEFWKSDVYNSSYAIWILEYLYKNWLKKYDEIEEKNNKNYYLIIDEINRWNISKIFGELITLLEADKRIGGENEIITKLPYSKKDFWIPENLYIIATMNTSDKSIVSLDTALRRRFWFVEMLPNYEIEELQKEIKGIKLKDILEKLNNRIEYLLDKDHLIGHSYFMKVGKLDDLKIIFLNEIYPLLEEYFYWEKEKIRMVLWKEFFEKKNIDKKLFWENNVNSDFRIEDDEKKYEIKKEIKEEDFRKVLENIIWNNKNNNEEN